MPKVSVVIPAYNAVRFLPQTLSSVFAQTFQDFEVVIVDDGSTDATAQWLTTVEETRVRFIQQPNQGAAVARNRGIHESKGEYIAFLDADDLWESTKLEQQVVCLDTRPEVGFVHTAIRFIDDTGFDLGRILKVDHKDGYVWGDMVVRHGVRCGSTPMIRRECFDRLGVFDTTLSFGEDWDMWLRVAARYPVAVLNEPLVAYRQHGGNMSKDYQQILPNYLNILDQAFANAPEGKGHLKAMAYGHSHLYSAWYAYAAGNLSEARAIHQKGIQTYPGLIFVKHSLNLSLKLAIANLRSTVAWRR